MRIQESVVQIALAVILVSSRLPAFAQAQIPGNGGAPDVAASQASGTMTGRAAKTANRKLVKKVAGALDRTKGLDSSRIQITARDGVVILSGSIQDNDQATLAVGVAQRLDGVREVRNELRISTQNW